MLFASEAQLVLIPYNFPLLHFIPETLKSVKRWLPLVFYLKPFYHIARILLRSSRLGGGGGAMLLFFWSRGSRGCQKNFV